MWYNIFNFSKQMSSRNLKVIDVNINVIIYISDSVSILTSVRQFPALDYVTG